jgi:hypothetical protein
VLGHHRVLALSFAELHQRNALPGHEVFQRGNEASRHRGHQGARRDRLTAMGSEEPVDPFFVLQGRHEHIQVHPVDPFDRQPHMTADDLSHALCYHRHGSGRAGFASRRRLDHRGP